MPPAAPRKRAAATTRRTRRSGGRPRAGAWLDGMTTCLATGREVAVWGASDLLPTPANCFRRHLHATRIAAPGMPPRAPRSVSLRPNFIIPPATMGAAWVTTCVQEFLTSDRLSEQGIKTVRLPSGARQSASGASPRARLTGVSKSASALGTGRGTSREHARSQSAEAQPTTHPAPLAREAP